MDDGEEGEFRPVPNVVNDRTSMGDGDTPVEVDDQPPDPIQEDAMQQLHGNVEESVQCPRAVVDSDEGLENNNKCSEGMETFDIPNEKETRGDELFEELISVPRDPGNVLEDYPTPGLPRNVVVGSQDTQSRDLPQNGPCLSPGLNGPSVIGKRTRDHRSPPSVGSTQGPSFRSRHDRSNSDKASLDLNRSAEYSFPGDEEGSSLPQGRSRLLWKLGKWWVLIW
ncbi:hypothetical protein Hanom_Chr15g01355841 [Helianthus anomalus]